MQTYRINTWISGNGTISLPNMPPDLYNKEVQLVITPKRAEKEEKNEVKECQSKKLLVSNFLRKWSGIIKDTPDLPSEEERLVDKLRYSYLKKKYDIDGSYVSDEDVDDARYEYLTEKYK